MIEEQLAEEIVEACGRVYAVGSPTPLEEIKIEGLPISIWLKREDLSPVKSYKWRGAYNAIAKLSHEERVKGIVAASAGNHAQGVALAAAKLGCEAHIFMPKTTPYMKQKAVLKHGGGKVKIYLKGDSYSIAESAASKFSKKTGAIYIHPFNDVATIAGQATSADEIIKSEEGPFDRIYVSIGGGGMASATAYWVKQRWPNCKVIGVEGVGQNSMSRALEFGGPVSLDYVDVFCDGSAVSTVGINTHSLCSKWLDEIITVTNDEVCRAIRTLWETNRLIPEPSGAMSMAGLIKDYQSTKISEKEKVISIISGANMDFSQLSEITRRSGIGSHPRKFLRVAIQEELGSLYTLLKLMPEGLNIVDLQYGRVGSQVQYPTLGLIGSEMEYKQLDEILATNGNVKEDVSTQETVNYRIINYDPKDFRNPYFVDVEFSERAGALLEFMEVVKDLVSICYFNYTYSGEQVGRALIGFDFIDKNGRDQVIIKLYERAKTKVHKITPVAQETLRKLLG